MNEHDTIAAISTAQGAGAIGIVRLSGSRAFGIAAEILLTKKDFKDIDTHTVKLARVVDPINKDIIDEVLVIKMQGPHTFTREDVVEINCHGGSVVLRRVLELAVSCGARLAEPGEFTKRAFLNGRMDLSQAEAVIDVINAKTERGAKVALKQLEGKLAQEIKGIRAEFIRLLAHCEVTIDYPEYDIDQIAEKETAETLKGLLARLEVISKSFDKGRIIRDGANVVIAGKPNVGKSSLLNALIGHQKAIVTDIPGTTRDIIEEYINIRGIPVKITDTAGLRDTDDFVEKIGVDKAKKALEAADLVIFMVDATESDPEVPETDAIVVINKIDLGDSIALGRLKETYNAYRVILASVKNSVGISELEEAITENLMHDASLSENDLLITNIRHKTLVDQAILSVKDAITAYANGLPLDCLTIDIKNAAESLGKITGESVSEDMLAEIFSRFCIGK